MRIVTCYRKPVNVQAVQVPLYESLIGIPSEWKEIAEWCNGRIVPPREFPFRTEASILIGSENRVPAFPSDWIVKSKSGEFYTIPPLLFAETYDVVSPPTVTKYSEPVKEDLSYLCPVFSPSSPKK